MIDSMHQSWLPRVVAAAFPSETVNDPFALLQRRQPQAVTAARYLHQALLCLSGASLSSGSHLQYSSWRPTLPCPSLVWPALSLDRAQAGRQAGP